MYLEKINSPSDIKSLTKSEIEALCSEIREFLIDNVDKTGGHLASNLGVVELSVAIHKVFDSPSDHIIFDVGHQSYVHKIITGRRENFSNLRKSGGLSGFTSRNESAHDPFGAGHSSTSVSAALGFAESDMILGKDNFTVAVLGDGAFTSGMIHEALNNTNPESRLVIILNENGMSISVNKGRFAGYLSGVRASGGYRRWKRRTRSVVKAIPLIGKPILALLTKIKTKIKNTFMSSNYFEDLGLYYIGPIDGNNYSKIESALYKAKDIGECVIVHVKTQKGKGYEPAEKNPDDFHSVYTKKDDGKKRFSEIFSNKLIELAEKDATVVAITAAMGLGTGLVSFEKKYPERYFDVGIAEEHAVTFAAALAANGLKPYTAIYSTFLQRAYDNIIHDVALQGLPVKLIIDRAGLAVSDGPTHHGIFDVAFLSHVPGMKILAPVTEGSLCRAIELSYESDEPIAIRYSNQSESEKVKKAFYPDGDFVNLGVRADFNPGDTQLVIITYGNIISTVIEAKEYLLTKGINVGILLAESLRPYSYLKEETEKYIKGAKRVLFVEEGIKSGGAAVSLRDALVEGGFDFTKTEFKILAIDDNFANPKEPCDLYLHLGFTKENIASYFEL